MEYQTEEYKGHTITIVHDNDCSESPREWDNLGTIYYKHRDYILGDKKIPESYFSDKHGDTIYIDSLQDTKEWIEEVYGKQALYIPIYIIDHSGVSIHCGVNTDRWDGSDIGFIAVSKKKVREEYNVKRITKELLNKVEQVLREEIETFNQYMTGQGYGYETDTNDSCYGYFGDEGIKGALEDAKREIDNYIYEEQIKKEKKLKAYITNSVPFEYRSL